jgi:hypothetical protein
MQPEGAENAVRLLQQVSSFTLIKLITSPYS